MSDVIQDKQMELKEYEGAPSLNTALVAVQSQLENPEQNKTVTVKTQKGTYKFKYATLGSIIDLIRPVLKSHGLMFSQTVEAGADRLWMVTTIRHEDGESFCSRIPMPALPSQCQEIGSVLTYMKRYSLCAALGIAAEEDDEAKAATENVWNGPLKKVQLKNEYSDLYAQIESATTLEDLEAYVEDFKDVIEQLKLDRPDWLNGSMDNPGLYAFYNQIKDKIAKQGELNPPE